MNVKKIIENIVEPSIERTFYIRQIFFIPSVFLIARMVPRIEWYCVLAILLYVAICYFIKTPEDTDEN